MAAELHRMAQAKRDELDARKRDYVAGNYVKGVQQQQVQQPDRIEPTRPVRSSSSKFVKPASLLSLALMMAVMMALRHGPSTSETHSRLKE